MNKLERNFLRQKKLQNLHFETTNKYNDLISFIDSADTTTLKDDEIWNPHVNSCKMDWAQMPREFDFMDNSSKFLNYANTKFQEEYEKSAKKRKYGTFNDNNNNNNNPQSRKISYLAITY